MHHSRMYHFYDKIIYHVGRPDVGTLLAYKHAVWRVASINDIEFDDDDRDQWMREGMPDPNTWRARPYRISLSHVGGACPEWGTDKISANVHARDRDIWDIYPTGRWPICSCCGEPTPCRAELQDRETARATKAMDKFTEKAKTPSCCWHCGEPVTTRQKSVTYPGDNLDLPGGPQPTFHTRAKCRQAACQYESRWIASDLRNERILTYPRCGGILVVHADGSTECTEGRDPLGTERRSEPDCRGHLTHDHGVIRACITDQSWEQLGGSEYSCPRGCTRHGHPGATPSRRPDRRDVMQGHLFGGSA